MGHVWLFPFVLFAALDGEKGIDRRARLCYNLDTWFVCLYPSHQRTFELPRPCPLRRGSSIYGKICYCGGFFSAGEESSTSGRECTSKTVKSPVRFVCPMRV